MIQETFPCASFLFRMSTTAEQDQVYDFSSELIDFLHSQNRYLKQMENAMASVKQDALGLIDRCHAINGRLDETHQKVLENSDAWTRTQHSINASLQNDAEVDALDVLQNTMCQQLSDILDESLSNKIQEQQQHHHHAILPLQHRDNDNDTDEVFFSSVSLPSSSAESSPRTAPLKR